MEDDHNLLSRILLLEYHQSLLLKLILNPRLDFYRLVIENGLAKHEVENFHKLCDTLNKKIQKQKAEGLMYFHPLFVEFISSLPIDVQVQDVIEACLKQKLYEPLFTEFKRYLSV